MYAHDGLFTGTINGNILGILGSDVTRRFLVRRRRAVQNQQDVG